MGANTRAGATTTAGGLTVPANGMGASWIVKLPSAQHKVYLKASSR